MTSHLKIVSRETSEPELRRGTKITNRYDNVGYVTLFTPGTQPIEDLGGIGAVFSGGGDLNIVYENLTRGTTPEAIARGNHMEIHNEIMGEVELVALEKAADENFAAGIKTRNDSYAERQALIDEGEKKLKRLLPPWATAVIVATLDENDCDSMTDYYNVKHGSLHILAWSKHNRDLFPEMRKAAANYEDTAHLSTRPTKNHNGDDRTEDNKSYWHPADEHREKYSMGSGYYLKAGHTYSSGWSIKKRDLKYYRDEICLAIAQGRYHIPGPEETATYKEKDGSYLQVKSITISRNLEKEGVEVRFPGKPDSDIRDRMKEHGFRWSRFSGCWYKKYSEEVLAFAESLQ